MYRITPLSQTLKSFGFSDWMDDFVKSEGFRLDVHKKDHVYHITAELPGFQKDDIQLSYEKDTLMISATSQDQTEEVHEWIHQERVQRAMKRSIYLPDLDESAIKAKLKDGLLMIEAPMQTAVASNIPIAID